MNRSREPTRLNSRRGRTSRASLLCRRALKQGRGGGGDRKSQMGARPSIGIEEEGLTRMLCMSGRECPRSCNHTFVLYMHCCPNSKQLYGAAAQPYYSILYSSIQVYRSPAFSLPARRCVLPALRNLLVNLFQQRIRLVAAPSIYFHLLTSSTPRQDLFPTASDMAEPGSSSDVPVVLRVDGLGRSDRRCGRRREITRPDRERRQRSRVGKVVLHEAMCCFPINTRS